MKQLLISFLLLLSLGAVKAQTDRPFTGTTNKKAEKLFGEALQAFTIMDYKKALPLLNKILEEDPKFIDAMMLLADLREQNDQFTEAINLYRKVIEINPDFQIPYYKLAYAALSYGEFETALNYIKQYKEKKGNQIDAGKIAHTEAIAAFGTNAVKNPVPFDSKNLGPAINSPLDEYFPGTTADEQTLIYTRLEGNMTEEFYVSKKGNDQNWTKSFNMGQPINTDQNEGTVSISADGQYVFFTACNRANAEGSCDLYFSALDGDLWREPRSLGFPVNTRAWESQPSVSFDGRTLYFSSNRPGGYGEMDLWYTTYTKGRWSPPINMGPEINTPGNEESPFIAKDDQTLYFSSDGHLGLGGNDLFISRKQANGKWGQPENLGFPINSHKDERCLAIAANGVDAYIATERPGGLGGLDILGFVLHEKIRPIKTGYVKGIVYDARTLKKLRARIELIDLETEKTVIEAVSNKLTGQFLFCLQGNKNYALNVSCEGYLFYSENFSLKNQPATEPLTLDVPLNQIIEGGRVVLKNIFFDVDKFELKAESKVELNKLIAFLKANATMKIEIGGHTDNTGVKEKNLALSNNRAKAVYDYLQQNGIDAARLSYKGYAEVQPIADNKTEAGRKQNRRTEFKILAR